MKLLKISWFVLVLLGWLTGFATHGSARADADVYVFWAHGCPHCARALHYLAELEAEMPGVRLHRFEITGNEAYMQVFLELSERRYPGMPRVPLIVIGEEIMAGFYSERMHGDAIRAAVAGCMTRDCPDRVQPLLAGREAPVSSVPGEGDRTEIPRTIDLPFLGQISLDKLSLPVLALVLGAADGFNPCAMWTLVFLLGLLVGIRSRMRRWALGSVFIATSALVYFLIMAAWLNVLLLVGLMAWIRITIGGVAIAAGLWAMREYVLDPQVVCRVTRSPQRQRILEGLRSMAAEPRFVTAVLGIAALAFAVNVIELLCSAGIPAAYTQVLTLSNLPPWQYYGYLGIYVLVFMLDDLIVFFTAMATLEITGLAGSYSRWANLVGGVMLLAIGSLLILKPEWLAFA